MLAPSVLEQVLPDPVLAHFDLPLRVRLYPLGLPLDIATNSPDVIEAARQSWGEFSQAFDQPALTLRIGVADAEAARAPSKTVVRSRDHLMSLIADGENFVMCDFHQSASFGWVTRATAADHRALRYRFLTPAVLCMAEQKSLAPIHGGLVARKGRGVVLFGESKAGKSTLAYACARAGWTYVSDDGLFLVRDRADRYAIGEPHSIRFRPDAKRFFPELTGRLAIARPNGKLAIEVFTRELPIRTAPGWNIDHIVYLHRQDGAAARLRPHSWRAAREACEQFVTYGAKEVQAAQVRSYQRLAGVGVWELRYSDFDGAISRLEQLISGPG